MNKMKGNMARFIAGLLLLAGVSLAQASIINLSFTGLVDASGAKVGGVNAPIGSSFSLDMSLDDTLAAAGTYGITALSYTTTVGTYSTVSAWTPLTASGFGAGMSLNSGFQNPGEHLLVNLNNFGIGSAFNDINSWNGASITGDIIVRGIGGFSSADQLSGTNQFTGTLTVSTVSTPATLSLLLAGLLALRLRNRTAE